jgi:hypothetical protein
MRVNESFPFFLLFFFGGGVTQNYILFTGRDLMCIFLKLLSGLLSYFPEEYSILTPSLLRK